MENIEDEVILDPKEGKDFAQGNMIKIERRGNIITNFNTRKYLKFSIILAIIFLLTLHPVTGMLGGVFFLLVDGLYHRY